MALAILRTSRNKRGCLSTSQRDVPCGSGDVKSHRKLMSTDMYGFTLLWGMNNGYHIFSCCFYAQRYSSICLSPCHW